MFMSHARGDVVFWSSSDNSDHKVYFFLDSSLVRPPFDAIPGVDLTDKYLLVPAGKEIGPIRPSATANHQGKSFTEYWMQVDDPTYQRPHIHLLQVPPVVDADG